MNKHLKLAQESLESKFYCLFREKNVLEISLDKEDLPFLFLVTENPEIILMSFSIDFDNAAVAAQIALELNDITKVAVAENFFMSKSGEVFWEEEALLKFMEESSDVIKNPLIDMKPISSLKN
jgi:hypothetical protein